MWGSKSSTHRPRVCSWILSAVAPTTLLYFAEIDDLTCVAGGSKSESQVLSERNAKGNKQPFSNTLFSFITKRGR